ncbi:unnamed protein product, partial [Polarella glacialis]
VSVHFREVAAQRLLVGGFSIAQKIQASIALLVGNKVAVPAGRRGTVLAEYSDTRLTVVFDATEDGVPNCFNVLPIEIRPWCNAHCEFPVGATVKASHHLLSMNAVVVEAGTRGVILGGVDESQVFVSFEGGQAVTIAYSALQRVPENPQEIPGEATVAAWFDQQHAEGLADEEDPEVEVISLSRRRVASDEETAVPEDLDIEASQDKAETGEEERSDFKKVMDTPAHE